jgi:hypothetical protein
MNVMIRRLSMVVVLAGAAAPAAAAGMPRLDQAMAEAGPQVVEFLQKGKYQAVGILPFLARVGDGGPKRAALGPIHRNLARRLEVALILALPDDKILLINGAGDAVAQMANQRLNHTKPSGRKMFFAPNQLDEKLFHPAWGDKHVLPDVYLYGDAVLTPDWKTLKVVLQAFDKDHCDQPIEVCQFTAATDARTLTEAGVSFARPRGVDENDEDQVVAKGPKYLPPPLVPKEARAEDPEKTFEELAKQSPVRMVILYNGKEVKADAGVLTKPTPDDRVTFRLTNTSKDRYGVVLKINGRNTIFKEESDPLHCFKWILEPNQEIDVKGFQSNDNEHEAFNVKSEEDSRRLAALYGENAGTITMVVFREADNPGDAVLVKNEEKQSGEDLAIARGSVTPPGGIVPREFESLKSALKEELKKGEEEARKAKSRGLILPGAKGKQEIDHVQFSPFPRPVASLTMRYYKPE